MYNVCIMFRARLNQVEQTKERDQELTLRTKYHLYPSDSPPPPEEKDTNLSNHLPFGQFNPKPGSGLGLDQKPLKNIDSGINNSRETDCLPQTKKSIILIFATWSGVNLSCFKFTIFNLTKLYLEKLLFSVTEK